MGGGSQDPPGRKLIPDGQEGGQKCISATGLEVDTEVWTHVWSVAELDRPKEDRWTAAT